MKTYTISNTFFLFFSGWSVLALLLAWGGIFYAPIFGVYAIVCAIYGIMRYLHNRKLSPTPSARGPRKNADALGARLATPLPNGTPLGQAGGAEIQKSSPASKFQILNSQFLLLLVTCSLSLLLASFLSPATIFSGRDEGSIFSASFELAQTHSLTFSSPESRAFFGIYGEGRALNFPGFYYTDDGSLTTQFPIAYIAWLASFISLFGLSGITLANAILLFLFLLAFGAIIQTFTSRRWVIIGTLLATTSFPIFWFSRFTLTENFALAFVWIFVLAVYQFTVSPKWTNFILLLLSAVLVLFGRIEGFAFACIALIIIFFSNRSRTFLLSSPKKYILAPILIFGFLGILSLSINTPFYTTVAKGFLQGSSETANGLPDFFSSLANRWNIFFLYGMGFSLLVGLLGAILLIKQKFSPKILTLGALIVSPSLLYLFVSFISPDHPWMLRRFMFSVIPLALLLSIFVCVRLFTLQKKYLGSALITLLFLGHLPAFVYFFPLTQGNDLLAETKTLAQAIPESELLLVDQLASGDGYHMFPGALSTVFHKHAVYFMNPYDLDILDTSAFTSVSMLVPESREDLYTPILREYNAKKVSSFPMSISILEHSNLSFRQFPERTVTKQNVLLYRWMVSP